MLPEAWEAVLQALSKEALRVAEAPFQEVSDAQAQGLKGSPPHPSYPYHSIRYLPTLSSSPFSFLFLRRYCTREAG